MNFGQLIENNTRDIFLAGSVVQRFIQFVFTVCQVENYRNNEAIEAVEAKLQATCFCFI